MGKDKGLNTFFFAALIFTALIILFVGYQAGQQNTYYKQTQSDFAKAIKIYQEGNSQEALPVIKKTAERYPDSYQVATVYAQVLYDNNQFEEALKYMRKAEEIYPAIILNPQFLLEHARVLMANGQFTDSKAYLEQVPKATIDESLIEQATAMMAAIDNFQKRGGE